MASKRRTRWWELPIHQALVDRLEAGGVLLDIDERTVPESEALEQTLKERAVVITGTVPGYTRDAAGAAVVARGGTSPGSISKKTFALVVGEGAGASKLIKAESLGIPTIDAANFEKFLSSGAITDTAG